MATRYMSHTTNVLFLCCALVCSASISCSKNPTKLPNDLQAAKQEPAVTPAPRVEGRALELLKKMSANLAQAKSFSFDAEVVDEIVSAQGPKLEFAASLSVSVDRPGSFASRYVGDLNDRQVWLSDGVFTLLDHSNKVIASAEVASNIDSALEQIRENYKISVPLGDIYYSDPYAAIASEIVAGFYVGLHQVRGVLCHHLVFGNDLIDFQVWIEDGKEPLLRKVIITRKTEPGAPSFRAEFIKWDLGAKFAKGKFAATRPTDYQQLDFLTAVKEATGGQSD